MTRGWVSLFPKRRDEPLPPGVYGPTTSDDLEELNLEDALQLADILGIDHPASDDEAPTEDQDAR